MDLGRGGHLAALGFPRNSSVVAKKGKAAQGQGLLQVKAGPTHIMASPSPLYDTSGLPLRGGMSYTGSLGRLQEGLVLSPNFITFHFADEEMKSARG